MLEAVTRVLVTAVFLKQTKSTNRPKNFISFFFSKAKHPFNFAHASEQNNLQYVTK
jgi:hypothetical protein